MIGSDGLSDVAETPGPGLENTDTEVPTINATLVDDLECIGPFGSPEQALD
jgi:hypothetical protein